LGKGDKCGAEYITRYSILSWIQIGVKTENLKKGLPGGEKEVREQPAGQSFRVGIGQEYGGLGCSLGAMCYKEEWGGENGRRRAKSYRGLRRYRWAASLVERMSGRPAEEKKTTELGKGGRSFRGGR